MQPPSPLAIQYLENVPGIGSITPTAARAKLRAAFERLPISHVLLGWNLPGPIVSACLEEASASGAQLLLWHPLLTDDGSFFPKREWHTIGLQGEPVPGFQSMPEFTFVCPNRPAARDAVFGHLRHVIAQGEYNGIFLDRIRFPSPATNPDRWLACFCDDCHRSAAAEGLELDAVQHSLQRLLATSQRIPSVLRALLQSERCDDPDPDIALLNAFLNFRSRSISSFVTLAADLVRSEGLEVGLDCFSPSLTRLVGQDLGALGASSEWTKVMTYGHTLGPAGLPFELLELTNWLVKQYRTREQQALEWLSQAIGLDLPLSRRDLCRQGLGPASLSAEIERARVAGIRTLLAGIELVAIEGVTHLSDDQIKADLRAFRASGAEGLVLSWDLWHIPLERLELVNETWTG